MIHEKQIDRLALEGCEIIGFRPGEPAKYDLAGFDRILRREVMPGSFSVRNASDSVAPSPTGSVPAQFDENPYVVRIAGFRRGDLFGPDEIGRCITDHGIPWNDGLGNGMLESLLIDRKFGLRPTLEAPWMGLNLPWTEDEWIEFQRTYTGRVAQMWDRLEELRPVFGGPLAGPGESLCVVSCNQTPLSLFAAAYDRQPQAVEAELFSQIGCRQPPVIPGTHQERAALTQFWAYLRTKHAKVLRFQVQAIREVLGQDTIIAGNFHELPPTDLEAIGRILDYPSVAVRPTLLTDEVTLRYYVAFWVQLLRDISGRAPMVSVRVNLLAAGCRFIPSGPLIRSWYDQAIRHGAGGFYFWTRDYPSSLEHEPYDGPICGNPDPSALPQERWETSLQCCGQAATHRRFLPPPSEVGILMPNRSALLHRSQWGRIYAAFAACAEASIHSRFIADGQIEGEGMPPEVKLLLAPVLEFVSPELSAALTDFTASGGTLVVTEPGVRDRAGQNPTTLTGVHKIDSANFDILSQDGTGSPKALVGLAEWISEFVRSHGIEPHAWVFDISCDSLPAAASAVGTGDSSIAFDTWMYEHSSAWILPHLPPG